LEKLPAVQTAAQDEMTFEQRAGVAEYLQNFVLIHVGDKLRGGGGKAKRKDAWGIINRRWAQMNADKKWRQV